MAQGDEQVVLGQFFWAGVQFQAGLFGKFDDRLGFLVEPGTAYRSYPGRKTSLHEREEKRPHSSAALDQSFPAETF